MLLNDGIIVTSEEVKELQRESGFGPMQAKRTLKARKRREKAEQLDGQLALRQDQTLERLHAECNSKRIEELEAVLGSLETQRFILATLYSER